MVHLLYREAASWIRPTFTSFWCELAQVCRFEISYFSNWHDSSSINRGFHDDESLIFTIDPSQSGCSRHDHQKIGADQADRYFTKLFVHKVLAVCSCKAVLWFLCNYSFSYHNALFLIPTSPAEIAGSEALDIIQSLLGRVSSVVIGDSGRSLFVVVAQIIVLIR